MFYILTVVVVTQVYTFVKTYRKNVKVWAHGTWLSLSYMFIKEKPTSCSTPKIYIIRQMSPQVALKLVASFLCSLCLCLELPKWKG